eukprot:1626885-Prymnesium_polylepis.1
MHRHIHRALVVCMPADRPDLLLDMVAKSGKMGPRNIVWLRNRLDPKHVGNHVKTVLVSTSSGAPSAATSTSRCATSRASSPRRASSTATSSSTTYYSHWSSFSSCRRRRSCARTSS